MKPASDIPPVVTVVTVTYNLCRSGRNACFRQCVESVHNQTYPAIEHLVIDGGSQDGTLELLQEYEQKGWFSYVSERDAGIYDAMNKGIARAKGKYIAFLNSDDYWHDVRGVEASVSLLEVTGADFSYGACRVINEDGTYFSTRQPSIAGFFSFMPFCHQTMFCRTDLLRELGGFKFSSYKIIADYHLVLRLMLRGGKPVHVPLNFTTFRNGGASCEEETAAAMVREKLAIHREFYSPLLEDEDIKRISKYEFPLSLLSALSLMVHPSVISRLIAACQFDFEAGIARFVYFDDRYLANLEQKAASKAPSQAQGEMGAKRKVTWRGPLGIPLLSCKHNAQRRTVYRLFCCLPILTIRRRVTWGEERHYYCLFSFLPVWRTVRRGTSSDSIKRTCKHYLLACIPVFSSRMLCISRAEAEGRMIDTEA